MKESDKFILQRIALETAQRLIDYDSYGKSEPKAIAAMKRRLPGLSANIYKEYLVEAISIHKEAISYVKANSGMFYQSYREKSDGSGLHMIAGDFLARHTSYKTEDLLGTLGMVFYLYHLR